MIRSVVVEGFRGLQRLEVGGLGRVNLIIGKNDCGKTALMEAVLIGGTPEGVGNAVLSVQQIRSRGTPIADFERFWKPLFGDQRVERGFSISTTTAAGRAFRATLRKAAPSAEIVTSEGPDQTLQHGPWKIDLTLAQDGHPSDSQILGTPSGVQLPPTTGPESGWVWIRSSKNVGSLDIRLFSELKQAGRDPELFAILQQIDERVSGVELLAPTGTEAELFVRLQPGTPLIPMAMMGDGFQRGFEIGVSLIAGRAPRLFIDELDNGLHHSVLEPVWRWIATISARRDLQVFATTHSEECIEAACRAFTALNDDGLRVLRLDRRETETVATVYDRAMVEAATRMDVEIRG